MMQLPRRTVLGLCLAVCAQAGFAAPAAAPYFPPAGAWQHKAPAELGLDPARLAEAVQYAEAHETERARDFS